MSKVRHWITIRCMHAFIANLIKAIFLIGFTIIFLIIYPVQMYITEEYLANGQSMFVFMAFKYCYGGLHIVLVPFLILIIKKDIRNAAVHTYIKTRPQEDGEITYEQFQKEVGLGVQPGV